MTQYVAIFSREYRQYWTQDQMGYTDHPKDFGWWPTEEAKKLIAGIGQDKSWNLCHINPLGYRSFYVKAVTNPKADKQCPLGCCFSAKLGETL